MRLWIWLGVCALAAALAVGWLLRPGSDLPSGSSVPAPRAGDHTRHDDGPAMPRAATRLPVAPERDPAVQPSPRGRDVRVRVVDRYTGAPVGGAEIRSIAQDFAVDELSVAERDALDDGGADAAELVERHGVQAVADADGYADLALHARVDLVVARKGNRYGVASMNELLDGDVRAIPVGRDFRLRVRVVHADGRPAAGVALHLHELTRDDCFDEVARTDAGGRAVIGHVQSVLEWAAGSDGVPRIEVIAGWPDGIEARAPVSWDEDACVELRLPPCGSIAVETATPRGEPVRGVVGFELRVDGRLFTAATAGDRHVFTCVPLGQRAHLMGQINSMEIAREVEGPVADGERVVVRCTGTAQRRTLVGRLVDGRGDPVPREDIFAEVATTDLPVVGYGRSAADGTFEIPLWFAAEHVASPRVTLRVQRVGSEWLPQRWELPMAGEPADLGTLRLGDARQPLLCSGTVALAGSDWRRPCSLRVLRQRGPWTWSSESATTCWVGTGRFELRGSLQPEGRLVVVAYAAWRQSEPVEFVVGARGLRLELGEPRGDLTVEVRHARGIPPDQLHGYLCGPDGALVGVDEVEPFFGRRGRLEFHRLPPGTYRLDLCLPSCRRAPLVSVPITIRAGAHTQWVDARAIDMDPHLRIARLQLQDGDPAACEVWVFRPGIAEPETLCGKRGGLDVAMRAGGTVDVLVTQEGFVPALNERVSQDTELAMVPMTRLRVRPEPLWQPPAGWDLQVVVTVTPGTPRPALHEALRRAHGDTDVGAGGEWIRQLDLLADEPFSLLREQTVHARLRLIDPGGRTVAVPGAGFTVPAGPPGKDRTESWFLPVSALQRLVRQR